MAIRFDGKSFAARQEQLLAQQVEELRSVGKKVVVHTFTFKEDAGSELYTKLKQQAAERIGIDYLPTPVSCADPTSQILELIQASSTNSDVTGVMVQKPSKHVWMEQMGNDDIAFANWWESLCTAIDPRKDVDCLTKTNLNAIDDATKDNIPSLLPATVAACLEILSQAQRQLQIEDAEWSNKHILVIGRSAIVGKPLSKLLTLAGHSVTNVGKDLSLIDATQFPILISAVGVPGLISGESIAEGSVVIDVGSPSGDVDPDAVATRASFYTPVPGGVGPVTISCLLENCIQIAQ